MAGPLQIRIITPERQVYAGEAERVTVPAHDGEVGILPRHARFLAGLGVGELRAVNGQTVQRFFVEGGFVQVRQNQVTVLCERAMPLAEANAEAASAAAAAAKAAKAPDAARLQERATVLRRILSHGAHAPS
jgi:F-type H+-transporting ATPase subunit epsilon